MSDFLKEYSPIIDKLLRSSEPSVRYKTLINVLGEDPDSGKMKMLKKEIINSDIVKKLLSNRNSSGEILSKRDVYDKWQGAHWVLSTLADIGYPAGDKSLIPAREQVLKYWLDDYFFNEFEAKSKADCYKKGSGVPKMQGRYRRCASQQGNALYYLLKLGLEDKRTDTLVERLLHWQWDDGGWNCDKNPSAHNSSFMETLLPLRGLALYGKMKKNKKALDAARRAAEIFLRRRMYLGERSGKIIHPEFIFLHYPLYCHYDILGGLKVLAEAGFIKDGRCDDALNLLKSKQLEGGWPAEKSYYKVSDKQSHGADYINWGGTSKRAANEWVTVDALFVIRSSI